jgi:hypothetical protein
MRTRIRILLHFDADPDSAFHFYADPDPDPASQNDADPCEYGSATLLKSLFRIEDRKVPVDTGSTCNPPLLVCPQVLVYPPPGARLPPPPTLIGMSPKIKSRPLFNATSYQESGSRIRCLFDPDPDFGIGFFSDPGPRIPNLYF